MFWNIRDGAPILSTLWFLRNLILLVALTPVFHFLVTRLKWTFPVLLAANYLVFHQNLLCLSSADIFFFGMGNWLVLNRNSGGGTFARQAKVQLAVANMVVNLHR